MRLPMKDRQLLTKGEKKNRIGWYFLVHSSGARLEPQFVHLAAHQGPG